MSKRRKRVSVHLSDTSQVKLDEKDIEVILRAADDIIYLSGRGMLVKILKGSKDKKLIEHELDKCPVYGYYNHLRMVDIEPMVDWMVRNRYLSIEYSGRLPLIVFSNKGWVRYQPVFVKEQIIKILESKDYESLAELYVKMDRELIHALLHHIRVHKILHVLEFLKVWQTKAYKKDAKAIGEVIRLLQGD
ncbi:DNA helicase II [Acidaminobacter sp. JC074]|uniref:RQC-minor-1 family DNA-binding protein n=1 Tax=Acidaminobacter sp. JC074 TaxID=2530199 RepID=UPI001F0D0975|nr:RQC-minor-1 family DNA-binding protein [Acidaminobacter sp. JC074]MCH4887119.1 DNA helicase II [Acidaminobacter sp. JC074]